ncbi:MAG TPA: ATP-binding cassette domain-containing protein [Candidatus Saccharimonadia bacterium]|nr:ATP-binding cassette domain-containing protein [Candidatus Saccharimonadia bacterium]
MITFRNLTLRRGPREILRGVDATLHSGWRVGVVGRNGCGKSSLFASVLGELDPDSGAVERPRAQRMASVAQETPGLPDAAIDFVLGGDIEASAALKEATDAEAREDHEAAAVAHHRIDEIGAYDARARAAKLLHGLGFKSDTHEHSVADFSGGWRARLNLGRALMAPSDALLLDEPTNHLDLDAVVWLEEWLRKYPGTLLLISHDRDFLDGVATHILHLVDGTARLYVGNYAQFERQRSEMLRQQQIAFEKEQAERAHLQSFIDRFKAKASKARQAQSRVKKLEKLKGTEAVRAEREFHVTFEDPLRLPDSLLKLTHVDAGYRAGTPVDGEDDDGAALVSAHAEAITRVLDNVRFGLEAGERIGLLGPNGEGKSTLVKTVAGALPPLAGSRIAHKDLVIGYFAQHTVDQLRSGRTPLQHIADEAAGVSEQVLRTYLGKWNFVGDRVFENVDGFSGGERARLALAMIAWKRPNLLLLDEPTNHLDLEMREALAEALNDFEGAIVLVSHDRNLLGLVCDSFWRVADSRVEPFDGDLDDYAGWLRARRNDGNRAAAPAKPKETPAERRKNAAAQREREQGARKQVGKLEKQIAALQEEQSRNAASLADPALYGAGGAGDASKLSRRQGDIAREIARLEAEWLRAYESIEGREQA